MNTTMRFVLHEFELEVHDAAYLVEVGPQNGNSDALKDLSRLPSWVFHSKHAIWLVRKNIPLMDRAMEGERIKKELIRRNFSQKPNLPMKQTSMLLPGAMKVIAIQSESQHET